MNLKSKFSMFLIQIWYESKDQDLINLTLLTLYKKTLKPALILLFTKAILRFQNEFYKRSIRIVLRFQK